MTGPGKPRLRRPPRGLNTSGHLPVRQGTVDRGADLPRRSICTGPGRVDLKAPLAPGQASSRTTASSYRPVGGEEAKLFAGEIPVATVTLPPGPACATTLW